MGGDRVKRRSASRVRYEVDRLSARRVAFVGGTRFVGAAAVRELVGAGYEVLVAHRGQHELMSHPALHAVEHCHGGP